MLINTLKIMLIMEQKLTNVLISQNIETSIRLCIKKCNELINNIDFHCSASVVNEYTKRNTI